MMMTVWMGKMSIGVNVGAMQERIILFAFLHYWHYYICDVVTP